MKPSPVYEQQSGKLGCLMLRARPLDWAQLQAQISDEDLYDDGSGDYGRESSPHLTLLHGFAPAVEGARVFDHLLGTCWPTAGLHFGVYQISHFEGELYDVLKIDVFCDGDLANVRAALEQGPFPFTSKFPEYHPHLTLAYLKKGMGAKYDRPLSSHRIWSNQLHYSGPEGELFYAPAPRRLPALDAFCPRLLGSDVHHLDPAVWPPLPTRALAR